MKDTEIRTKFVCVELNSDSTCKRVMNCVNLTENEYKKKVNEQSVSLSKEQAQKEELDKKLKELDRKLGIINFVLAKGIYDNLIDSGEIDYDSKFQEQWHDYIFNGKEIGYQPEVFKEILEKVVKL